MGRFLFQQGGLYKQMRSKVMGYEEEYVDPMEPSPKSRVCVAALKRAGSLKARVPSTRPSAQECVGQHSGEWSVKQVAFEPPSRQHSGKRSAEQVTFEPSSVDS